MPQASQGQRAGWWPSYSSVADTNVRPRATSAKWSPTRERRSFFGELEVPKAAKAHVGPSAALPKPQFSRKISWEEHLDVLRVYVAREGHALVPLAHEERGVRLLISTMSPTGAINVGAGCLFVAFASQDDEFE